MRVDYSITPLFTRLLIFIKDGWLVRTNHQIKIQKKETLDSAIACRKSNHLSLDSAVYPERLPILFWKKYASYCRGTTSIDREVTGKS